MKKIFLWMSVALVGLFTSCSEDAIVNGGEGDVETMISITVPDGALTTRAAVEGSKRFEDPAMSGMRVALIVSNEEGKVLNIYQFDSHDFGANGSANPANFKIRFVKGQKYNITAWADFGAEYYTLPAVPDAQGNLSDAVVTAPTTRTGSLNSNDCYFKNELIQITENQSINLVLKRPVALVKVNTMDWNLNEVKYANFRPDFYQVKVTAPTELDLISGVAANPQEITCSAQIVEYNLDGVTKEMHYDYFFANTESAILPAFTVNYYQGGAVQATAMSDYTFENIPVQRNYKTNITGNILTKLGDINVTIDNTWFTPDKNITLIDVNTVDDAQSYINTHADETDGYQLNIKEEITDEKALYIPDGTTNEKWAFNIENMTSSGSIKVYDQTANDPTVNFQNNVEVKVPAGITASQVTITTAYAHATINGSFGTVVATTGPNTLVVEEGSVVENLEIKLGGVEIYGTVNNVTVTGTADSVFVRECVGISTAVKDVLLPYLAPGYVATEVVSGVWNIAPKNEWKYFAAAKFSNINEGNKVINLTTPEEFALFAKNVNAGTTYEGWTINMICNLNMYGKKWTPVGNYTDNTPFMGTFDGQGNEIQNIDVYQIDKRGTGVFGKVYAPCVIKNVKVVRATVLAEGNNTYTGGLVGHGYATITDCSFQGTITAGNQIGGIAAAGGFTITGCTFEGTINGKYWGLGGIIGNCQDGGPITRNKVKGTINGVMSPAEEPFVAGGIIGCAIYSSTPVMNNYSDIAITYNGVAQKNYPIMGIYNIDGDGSGKNPALTKYANLLTSVAGNTWNKAIYAEDSYAIDANNDVPEPTKYVMNYDAATTKEVVAQVGETKYETLAEAVSAAKAGADKVVTIIASKAFTLPADVAGLTIQAAQGVVATFNIATECSIANADEATLKGLKFVLPGNNYTGFHHSDATFENCAFEGLLTTYGSKQVFKNCSFKSSGNNYSVNAYGNCSFDGCSFTCDEGKAIYLYTEALAAGYVVDFNKCTFQNTGSKTRKPAIIIKTRGNGIYTDGYKTTITNCTATGFADFESKGDDVFNYAADGLWGVECPNNDQTNTNTVVTVNTTQVYPVAQ